MVSGGGRFSKWGEVGERDGFSPQIGGKVGPSAPTHVYIEQIFSLRRATNTTIWLCQCSASSHLSPIVVQIRPENRVGQQRAIVTAASLQMTREENTKLDDKRGEHKIR